MSKVTICLLVLLNLALAVYSAHYFLVDGGYSWKEWMEEQDPASIPLAIFALVLLSRKMILVNVSLPFLVLYGPVYFFYGGEISGAHFAAFELVLMMVDIVYILVADIQLQCWKYMFWGILSGFVLLMIYHRFQFGENLNVQLPVLRVFGRITEQLQKFADSHGG